MNGKLNLQDIAALLAEKSQITKKDAELFLKEWIDTISTGIIDEQLVKIKNLGSLKVSAISERESVDVVSGNRVTLPAHYKINLIPDSALSQVVNEPFALFEAVDLKPEEEEKEEVVALPPAEDDEEEQPYYSQIRVDDKPAVRRRINWSSLLYVLLLLVIAGVFFYLYVIDKAGSSDDLPAYQSGNVAVGYPEIKTMSEVDSLLKDSSGVHNDRVAKKDTAASSAPVAAPATGLNKTRTIHQGERLTLISLDEYGDKVFWIYLYEENKNIIHDPDLVPAGLIIKIPPASKYNIDKNSEVSIQRARDLRTKYWF